MLENSLYHRTWKLNVFRTKLEFPAHDWCGLMCCLQISFGSESLLAQMTHEHHPFAGIFRRVAWHIISAAELDLSNARDGDVLEEDSALMSVQMRSLGALYSDFHDKEPHCGKQQLNRVRLLICSPCSKNHPKTFTFTLTFQCH